MDSRPHWDTAGVSSVVGVILLVAVAIGLSVVLFVVVNPSSDERPVTPAVGFVQDPESGELRVAAANFGDWSDIVVTLYPAEDNACTVQLNDGAARATGDRVATAPTPIRSGDVLVVASDPPGKCTLSLAYVPANQAIAVGYAFDSVPP